MTQDEQDLHNQLHDIQDDLTQEKGHSGVLKNQLQQKQDIINNLNKQLEDLKINDTDDEIVKQHLKDQLLKATEDKNLIQSNLDKEKSSHQQDLKNLNDEIADITERLTKATSNDFRNDEIISNLKQELTDRNNDLQEKQNTINNINKELDETLKGFNPLETDEEIIKKETIFSRVSDETNDHHEEQNENQHKEKPFAFSTNFQNVGGERTDYDKNFFNKILKNTFKFLSKFILGVKTDAETLPLQLRNILIASAFSSGIDKILETILDEDELEPNRFNTGNLIDEKGVGTKTWIG